MNSYTKNLFSLIAWVSAASALISGICGASPATAGFTAFAMLSSLVCAFAVKHELSALLQRSRARREKKRKDESERKRWTAVHAG